MTSTSAEEGGKICVELLAGLAAEGVSAVLVTHFNHIWPELTARFGELGLTNRLKSMVMTTQETPAGLRYLYKLKESAPPPSSHARAVVAAKGVSLSAMLASLTERGLDMRAGDPGWERIRHITF